MYLIDTNIWLERLLHQEKSEMDQFDLDFDDAYQYVAAEKYGLTIVSLDHDFDQTERGRKTPDEVLSV
jgi:predicted nucleic acid-binding protein